MKAPKKILIADDEPMIRKVLRRSLTHAGYLVDDAGTLAGALQMFKLNRPYDVLLCDVNLGADSGWSLAGQIALLQPGIRVIILSGEIMHSPPAEEFDYSILFKPFHPNELKAAIEESLRREDDEKQ